MKNSFSSDNYQEFDVESGDLNRKRSLVRHDRARNDPHNPHYHYANVVAQESDHIKVQSFDTGLDPTRWDSLSRSASARGRSIPLDDLNSKGQIMHDFEDDSTQVDPRGTEIQGLNDEQSLHRNNTIRSNKLASKVIKSKSSSKYEFWPIYCTIITFWAPSPLLRLFGFKTKERQFAWREKMGLISIILYIGTFVAYLTFGFSRTVCSNTRTRIENNSVSTGYLIINGRAYDLTASSHPAAAGIDAGTNILYPPINAGGKDASFLFQNVNGNCKGLITPKEDSEIPFDGDEVAWYMPCKLFAQDGSSSPNFTASEYYNGWGCHTSTTARDAFYSLDVTGDVYFTWNDIRNSSRNLVVFSGDVLDLDLISWIDSDNLNYPELFDRLRTDEQMRGHDISILLSSSSERKAARCLVETIKVGVIDSETIGCIASDIVLYVSLIFILSVVISKFLCACYFKWVISRRQGATTSSTKEMNERERDIEDWADDINKQAPVASVQPFQRFDYRNQSKGNRVSKLFNRASRYSMATQLDGFDYVNSVGTLASSAKYPMTTMTLQTTKMLRASKDRRSHVRNRSSVMLNTNASRQSLLLGSDYHNPFDANDGFYIQSLSADLIHPDVAPQPPVEYQPYGYPLAHVITLITCYSEDEDGLRTTIESIATTDYPNSHKLILVICDGMIKGAGNDKTTPEIALDLMTDFVTPPDDVQPFSYVSVAQGSKRHNMAKVYAGFYNYKDSNLPPEKQQRVPVVTIVKCGTPAETGAAKPGNRGKRDSQIILMSFLQKVMFDERMTQLENEMLKSIFSITGLMTEMYEIVLMVDADTKVYPDSLTHMVAEMVKDPTVMGLCGETKIANKRQSWVTAIQVFEYYISHHQAKAFESCFGSVTCLPGCFCMYRIKTPKGRDGYWVPILANPDIVERYSDNVLDTLHKKNLLLLGEDRYLSSLMLQTFPKRKQIFVPKAACKTIVPERFKVLLSQRRRWINSTVHNLFELFLVNDLCGTFCFSMQFVIGIELVGTLVLPAAICFTVYVIIFAIVSHPTPILSLVLLGIIFGLPGLLIVVTVSSWSYILWLLVYLVALPIWNFVLPSYAYWKFDDFSWGETRVTSHEIKDAHGEIEGLFDGSHIIQKRWREFERDRRRSNSPNLNHRGSELPVPSAAWDPANINHDFEKDSDVYVNAQEEAESSSSQNYLK
ncbi:Chitin synthase 3 [Komagataella phaffii CBS 7435]|uniref:chitin synthase n=2 Tax=Komagataella phaffii TaxID=460519 RepID=C4QZJ2_KOMPG|nr:Chitin synthase III, catalyzes the transfer of N-acetylglucosamine (GlcNAc) to chitin [Komagataella phaffii GS115]AOA62769.1 GQ67_00088T0 [Komagataella phaffii]CAH2448839.1 Chitin synthase 3 [Komagataella phaffii CBS 7435]AOA67795.1 GQ68_01299T0 [Komagataella phaffii GS115]CAY68666.1 Chitin synthase III, catalyzes the transfer of N-acetylglucosamine (GlcNAc) to chitin [Komagataella phaffii GS115]CCA38920.1 Chitin synthase 3 [Komagataella phaffii CBS 7435]